MPRSFAPRRALALSLALLLAAWANVDLAAFHGLRAGDAAPFAAAGRAQLTDAAQATPARAIHDSSHDCAFASVAHTAHTAAVAAAAAPHVVGELPSLAALPRRPIPGRTASGLAPPA